MTYAQNESILALLSDLHEWAEGGLSDQEAAERIRVTAARLTPGSADYTDA